MKHPDMSDLDNPRIKDPVERLEFWISEMRSWYPIFLESEGGIVLGEIETILNKIKNEKQNEL